MASDMMFDFEKMVNKAYDLLYMDLDGIKQKHADMVVAAERVLDFMRLSKQDPYYDTILKRIVDKYEIEVGIKFYDPMVIVDPNTISSWLYEAKSKGTTRHAFFDRYKQYLRREGFSPKAIENIERSCEKTLSLCANPRIKNATERKRGLVVGDVQSGKTANYLGLINMAYDYGYRIVVLLAGMTDSLRLQTQKRTDEGVVGAISDSIGNEIVYCGVGEPNGEHYVIPFTNRENDFGDFINKNLNATINDFKKPVALVVKKNSKILDSVLNKLQSAVTGYDSNSILIIDDEADNASISTAKDEDKPTAINKRIRGIFNKFPVASYVGFTATPFANIFINPEDKDPDNLDLFPSDFIVQLVSPDSYFGGGKIFLQEGGTSRFIRILEVNEPYFLPVKHKKEDSFYTMPESMKEAIHVFIIGNVIRTLRGQGTKHRSMMINISRFNGLQWEIKDVVVAYVTKLKNVLEQDSYKSTEKFIENVDMAKLFAAWNNKFFDEIRNGNEELGLKPIDWEQIKNGLYDEVKQIQTIVINSKISASDKFNYDDYEEVGARVITIGGFVLSRGLTLEGLMVSYYSRNAGAYDVLLQMGRWFGYRPKYEDLCRIYMSQDNVDRFTAVFEAVSDLKEQFAELERHPEKSPRDFGLMVQESPDTLETSLLVTSRNKMRNSDEIVYHLNYGGVYADTSKIIPDASINTHNADVTLQFFNKIKVLPNTFQSDKGRRMVRQVSKYDVADFIRELKISYFNKKFETQSLAEYIEDSDVFPYWDVVVATGSREVKNSVTMAKFDLQNGYKAPVRSFRYSDDDEGKLIRVGGANNRILDPGIFDAGLSIDEEQKKQILEQKDKDDPGRTHTNLTAKDYLKLREYPILVLYPFFLETEGGKLISDVIDGFSDSEPVWGYAIGFPKKESTKRVKYRINKVKIDELSKGCEIDTEEEDNV